MRDSVSFFAGVQFPQSRQPMSCATFARGQKYTRSSRRAFFAQSRRTASTARALTEKNFEFDTVALFRCAFFSAVLSRRTQITTFASECRSSVCLTFQTCPFAWPKFQSRTPHTPGDLDLSSYSDPRKSITHAVQGAWFGHKRSLVEHLQGEGRLPCPARPHD